MVLIELEGLKFAVTIHLAQCVMMAGMYSMLVLYVDSLDSFSQVSISVKASKYTCISISVCM